MIKADWSKKGELVCGGEIGFIQEEFIHIVAYVYALYKKHGEKNIDIFNSLIEEGVALGESLNIKNNVEVSVSEEYKKEIEEIIKRGKIL